MESIKRFLYLVVAVLITLIVGILMSIENVDEDENYEVN